MIRLRACIHCLKLTILYLYFVHIFTCATNLVQHLPNEFRDVIPLIRQDYFLSLRNYVTHYTLCRWLIPQGCNRILNISTSGRCYSPKVE